MKILIVNSGQKPLISLQHVLKKQGFSNVETCKDSKDALRRIEEKDFDLVLLDILPSETEGFEVLKAAKSSKPKTEFVVISAVNDLPTIIQSVRLGALDFLEKPVDEHRLFITIERVHEQRQLLGRDKAGLHAGMKNKRAHKAFAPMITINRRMKGLITYAGIIADSKAPILITGERGTGKDLMANAIHQASPASNGPFVKVTPSHQPASGQPASGFINGIFESVKERFTGTHREDADFFEQADGGTLFLDEIADLSPGLQMKLDQVLTKKHFSPRDHVAQDHATATFASADVRIISAASKNPDHAVLENRLTPGLLHKLKYAHIHLPPLSERTDDIPLLAAYFLAAACRHHSKNVRKFSTEAMNKLINMEYPGNVRELAQVVEHAVIISDSPFIKPKHLINMGFNKSPSENRKWHSFEENTKNHADNLLPDSNSSGNDNDNGSIESIPILGATFRHVQRRLADLKNNARWKSLVNLKEGES